MSRFYASIQGNRGEATRCGTKDSDITGHIRGWDKGVKVIAEVDEDDNDTFYIFETSGSNDSKPAILIDVIK
jgi:hypothetical protein|tara:strand:- start:3271 stop:3486 length:216 start_codon:yes stop_codon:yes gene_type:complete